MTFKTSAIRINLVTLLLCIGMALLAQGQTIVMEHSEERLRLRQKNPELGIAGPIATSGAGAGLLVGAAVLGAESLRYSSVDCPDQRSNFAEPSPNDDCYTQDIAPTLGYVAIGAGVVRGALLAIRLPWLLNRLQEKKVLRQRIRTLKNPPAMTAMSLNVQITPKHVAAIATFRFWSKGHGATHSVSARPRFRSDRCRAHARTAGSCAQPCPGQVAAASTTRLCPGRD